MVSKRCVCNKQHSQRKEKLMVIGVCPRCNAKRILGEGALESACRACVSTLGLQPIGTNSEGRVMYNLAECREAGILLQVEFVGTDVDKIVEQLVSRIEERGASWRP